MTTIYLIRHAEAEGNLYRRIHGWYDALITENGYAQIRALEERFRDIHVDAVWSSDLFRTMTTAGAIYKPKNLPLHTDPDLREVHLGDWEDHTWGEMRRLDPTGLDRFNAHDPTWQAPNGEFLPQTGARVEGALRRIAQAHPGQTVAVFCHGTAIRQTVGTLMGLTHETIHQLPHSDNTAVNCLTYENGQFQVVFHSDASHLSPAISTLARQSWWRKDGKKSEDVNLWYRPIQWETEQDRYLAARLDAWTSTHGHDIPFDGEAFLQAAEADLKESPWGVTVAMSGDDIAGILQLNSRRYAEEKAGYISFCYVTPDRRGQSLGIQLIGQAISHFRPLGRDKLRLRCAPYNHQAQSFYGKYGFRKVGEEAGSRVPLDILEKYIGYDVW